MRWLLIVAPLLVPAAGYLLARRLSPGRPLLQLGAAGLSGALPGAFLASAASAMASGVDPTAAVARGSAIGFGLGLGVGLFLMLVLRLARRFR